MEIVKFENQDYIMNKYHMQDKPFNPFSRFIRNDEIFCDESGLSPQEIISGIIELDNRISEMPHPIRKAKAFEYVLKNTRLSCDSRDIFPAINMIDRPLNATIVAKWRKEVFSETIPEIEKERSFMEKNGIATIWPDFDHSVPNWDIVFELGFKGILENSEKARLENKNFTEEQNAFYDGIQITYSAIIVFLERLEMQAEKDKNITEVSTPLLFVSL